MKVKIIKEDLKDYYSGDILVIANPYESFTYLLTEDTDRNVIGAVDLSNGQVFKELHGESNEYFDLICLIEREIDASEWKVFGSKEIELILGTK